MKLKLASMTALLLSMALLLCACSGIPGAPSAQSSESASESSQSTKDAVDGSAESAVSPEQSASESSAATSDAEDSESEESSSSGSTAVLADPIEVTFTDNPDGSVSVSFSRLPSCVAELEASDAEYFQHPHYAAAMFLAIMCGYGDDPEEALDMVDHIKGPEPLSTYDRGFLEDRMADKLYLPFSYFSGATVENDYTPDEPYTVTLSENPYSRDEDGVIKFFIASAGADSPRPVTVRQKKSTGEWFLWEQSLLVGIRLPASQDKWS